VRIGPGAQVLTLLSNGHVFTEARSVVRYVGVPDFCRTAVQFGRHSTVWAFLVNLTPNSTTSDYSRFGQNA
jgi:hypothetical protein